MDERIGKQDRIVLTVLALITAVFAVATIVQNDRSFDSSSGAVAQNPWEPHWVREPLLRGVEGSRFLVYVRLQEFAGQ
jgi:hypothetical protein